MVLTESVVSYCILYTVCRNLNNIFSYRFRALYKGFVPKVMRLGPGAGIMMIVYENVHGYLINRFPDS